MKREILTSAAHWYAQLESGEAAAADRAAWQHWLDAHPDHRRAWNEVEALRKRLRQVPGALTASALRIADERAVDRPRRAVLGALAVGGIAAAVMWSEHEQRSWRQQFADYRTAIGERREWTLADGSRLLLNTASAADVQFDAGQRLVRLHAGEILIETAKDGANDQRPFRVQTADGLMRALGTRFSVRVFDDATELAVLEHAVEIRPAATAEIRTLEAGNRLRFTQTAFGDVQPVREAQSAWSHGMLVVYDQPLSEFAAELGRYRPGTLACNPAIADLRVSGAYPLDNTELALAAVEKALPVSVHRRAGIWGLFAETRIEPRGRAEK